MPVVRSEDLFEFAKQLLRAGGAGERAAEIVARSLVDANLRGLDSHGVMRIPSYLQLVKDGKLQPDSGLQVVNETASTMVCDGGWGFGQVLASDLLSRLIEKAQAVGTACGTLRQSAHIGRLAEYAERAADAGMASMIFANTHGAAQRVAPPGGIRPRLGTNPLCMGVPGGADGPFVIDFGTSATAEGKVRVHRIAGKEVPAGWLLDANGNPSTDPNVIYGDPPGTILPMGGAAAYRGFGLSFLIEMLCSGLSGAPCANAQAEKPLGNAAVFLVFSPEHFAGTDHLRSEIAALEEYVRAVPKADGIASITLPGDPERATCSARAAAGIAFDEGNWAALTELAETLNVVPPAS